MKINKVLVLAIFLVSALAITVASQISQVASISIEEKQDCTITYYNQTENVYDYVTRERDAYGNCKYFSNFTLCLNTSGPNTDCSAQQRIYNFSCITGKESYQSYEVTDNLIVLKNRTDCHTNSYLVSVDKGSAIVKKEIDFSSWGACIYNAENNCLIVTCQSIYDGANDGQFHGCKSGTSCQKFIICDDKVQVFYKNSRNDFVAEDPTFHLSKLALKEAGQ